MELELEPESSWCQDGPKLMSRASRQTCVLLPAGEDAGFVSESVIRGHPETRALRLLLPAGASLPAAATRSEGASGKSCGIKM